jgi:hypothetical protein
MVLEGAEAGEVATSFVAQIQLVGSLLDGGGVDTSTDDGSESDDPASE